MKFQDSKLEIEAPKSKAYILHCKMYVFSKFGMKFQGSKPEIEAPESF